MIRRAATTDIHAHASTTAAVKATMIQAFFDPEATPKKAAKKIRPVAAEYAAHPACWNAANR